MLAADTDQTATAKAENIVIDLSLEGILTKYCTGHKFSDR